MSPPSLMVAANAGDAIRTVAAPTTAACEERRTEGDVSVSRWWFYRDDAARLSGAPRSSVEVRDARRAGDGSFGSTLVMFDSVRMGRSVARAPRHRTPDARHPNPASRDRFFRDRNARTFLRPSREATGATAFLAATLTGALTATAEPRKVEVMAAILMCVVTCIRGYGSDGMRGIDARL